MSNISAVWDLVRRKTTAVRTNAKREEESDGAIDANAPFGILSADGDHDVRIMMPTSRLATPLSEADPGDKLWQQAYDRIKTSSPEIMAAYERILSNVLKKDGTVPGMNISPHQQRLQVIQHTRESILRVPQDEAATRSTDLEVAESMVMATTMPSVLDKYPQSALPWSANCLALLSLKRYGSPYHDNASAIIEIAFKMNWYCSLPSLLVEASTVYPSELQTNPEASGEAIVARLYESLLRYQIATAILEGPDIANDYDFVQLRAHANEIKAKEEKLPPRCREVLPSQFQPGWQNTTTEQVVKQAQLMKTNLNNVTAVQRNLIYQLAVQKADLVPYILERYERDGPAFADSYKILADLLTDMLRDPCAGETYLMVDALDECLDDVPLLDLINRTVTEKDSRTKWFVTSRQIIAKSRFSQDCRQVELLLGQHAKEISKSIDSLMKLRLREIVAENRSKKLSRTLLQAIQDRAQSTFQWASLVLEELKSFRDEESLLNSINELPTSLIQIYSRMMDQIQKLMPEARQRCLFVLSIITVSQRPLQIMELTILAEFGGMFTGEAVTRQAITACGPFITIINEDTVSLVHQSAQEFLSDNLLSGELGPTHFTIFSTSLRLTAEKLKQYVHPARAESPIKRSIEVSDSLTSIRYSCVYWIDHLCAAIDAGYDYKKLISTGEEIKLFFSTSLLRWLQCLSRFESLPDGLRAIPRLLSKARILYGSDAELVLLLQDADVWLKEFFPVVYQYPEQIYGAPLIFSPSSNQVQKLFQSRRFSFIKRVSAAQPRLHGCLVLEGHEDVVRFVVFSTEDNTLLSASNDHMIIHWNFAAIIQRKYHGHLRSVLSLAWIPGRRAFVSASSDKTVQITDIHNGTTSTLATSNAIVKVVAVSPNGSEVLFVSREPAVHLLELSSGQSIWTRSDFSCRVNGVDFSPEGETVALALHDGTIQICDTSTGKVSQTLCGGHEHTVFAVAFSRDGELLASASHDERVCVWNASNGTVDSTLVGHTGAVFSVAFSPDRQMLVSTSSDESVRIWNPNTGDLMATLQAHSNWVNSVAFSVDGKLFATGSHDKTVRIWDVSIISNHSQVSSDSQGHNAAVKSVTFSPDGKFVASISNEKTVKLWNSITGDLFRTLAGHLWNVQGVAFSPDHSMLASASNDRTVLIWDIIKDGKPRRLAGHTRPVNSVVFSADSSRLASASNDTTVRIWDVPTGQCVRELKGHNDWVNTVVFSQDGKIVAAAARDKVVRLWNAQPGTKPMERSFTLDRLATSLEFSEDGNHIKACGQWFDTNTCKASKEARPEQPAARTIIKSDWILQDGEKALWLPRDYRPTCSAQHGNSHALGLSSGRVAILEFDWAKIGLDE
ncbi:Vegetative incompatibility protein HET-E-1 [Colletotrichum aenigma]|uniref:Vegetative incompatibility protein HET-E-1 n=1 Tax=Colletotrichum aenigma TaxID=1215731 RepID=UPI001872D2AA|nr:Vegetative incompatibility protein HET-E-1 [Colletotrichum aenigma]KAF5522140.1 Vegetative incompatibility protein HET-E-1 [Colletotrichum aenigma]